MNNATGQGGQTTGITLFVSSISNPGGRSAANMVFILSTAPNYNSLVAAALSAVAAEQEVGFYSSGCGTMPFWGGTTTYPYVVTLWAVP